MPKPRRSKKTPAAPADRPPVAERTPRAGRTPRTARAAGHLLRNPHVARPLPSLVFLSPLLAFYAFGLLWVRPDLAARADILVRQIIAPLGVSGALAPLWLVIGILLLWHLVRRDPWRVPLPLVGLMAAETALLTVPLFAIMAASSVILHGYLDLAMPAVWEAPSHAAAAPPVWLVVAMTSIGAGIYEELLFRLALVGGVLLAAQRVLNLRSSGLTVAVVLAAAAVFAGAHTMDDPRQFAWDSFLFRTAAGAYLGYVFVRRGFGIASGVHIVFDLVIKLGMVMRQAG